MQPAIITQALAHLQSPLIQQLVVPSVLGVALSLVKFVYPGAVRLNGLIFLFAQLWLIHLCGYASVSGLVFVLVLLGGFAFLATGRFAGGPSAQAAAAILFGAYLVYWVIEKYFVPLGVDALSGMFPALASFREKASLVVIVGISYVGFKFIHFFVDDRAGEIKRAEPVEFLNWLLFFPSIVAGPMQRFEDWQEQRAAHKFNIADLVEGAQRVLQGMILKFVLAEGIHGMTLAKMNAETLSTASFGQLVLATFIYSFYLYFDFAGYSHMAIGIGRLWGVTLPENFNHPFIARNLAEFWNRWHISLSQILRDYIFYPLSLYVKRRRFFARHQNLAAGIPPLVTFIIAGIWHGAGIGFVMFGVLQGIGLAFLAIRKRKKTTSRFGLWWHASITGRIGATLINFSYVSFSLMFFCLPWERMVILMNRLI